MPRSKTPFVQRLDGLALSIEKGTDRCPDRQLFHVFLNDETVQSFRALADAQARFRELRDELGWQPPQREQLSADERLARQKEANDRLDYLEYWGTSHKFRGGGRPKRRQH